MWIYFHTVLRIYFNAAILSLCAVENSLFAVVAQLSAGDVLDSFFWAVALVTACVWFAAPFIIHFFRYSTFIFHTICPILIIHFLCYSFRPLRRYVENGHGLYARFIASISIVQFGFEWRKTSWLCNSYLLFCPRMYYIYIQTHPCTNTSVTSLTKLFQHNAVDVATI